MNFWIVRAWTYEYRLWLGTKLLKYLLKNISDRNYKIKTCVSNELILFGMYFPTCKTCKIIPKCWRVDLLLFQGHVLPEKVMEGSFYVHRINIKIVFIYLCGIWDEKLVFIWFDFSSVDPNVNWILYIHLEADWSEANGVNWPVNYSKITNLFIILLYISIDSIIDPYIYLQNNSIVDSYSKKIYTN
jgi:hypothetical protein